MAASRPVASFLAFAALAHGLAEGQAFRHPGVVVNRPQLEFLKARIQAGEQPWKSAYDRMRTSNYASLSYTPRPRESVDCGPYSNPNNGCTEERNDAVAAYAHALLWSFTGNRAHADKAIQILNAWSAVLKTHTNHNAPLQAGWAASVSVRAAEIVRHTYDGWSQADAERFGTMLRTAYLPLFPNINPGNNGNWHLIAYDAAMGAAVYLDDRTLFNAYVNRWRNHTRAYIYIREDGPTPNRNTGLTKDIVTHWHGQSVFMDGLAQETCRDFGHTGYGLAAINTAAETAALQGLDLYGEEAKRIVAGMEFHAEYILGKPVPGNLCDGRLNLSTSPTWEVSYNHFANRKGMAMPFTKRLIETRARPTGVDHHMAWESLTHAETGNAAMVGTAIRPRGIAGPAARGARLSFGENGRLVVLTVHAESGLMKYGLDGAGLRLP